MAVRATSSYNTRSNSYSRPSTAQKSSAAAKTSTTSRSSSSSSSRTTSSAPKRDTYTPSSSANTRSSSNSNKTNATGRQTTPTTKSNINRNVRTNVNVSQSVINNKSQIAKGVGIGVNQNPLAYSRFKFEPSINLTNPQGSTVFKITDKSLGRINGSGNPVGEWAFRIDKPHGNSSYHMNTNAQIPQYYTEGSVYKKINHKTISSTTYKVAGNASKISKAAKIGGKALCAVAIASDANDIYKSFKGDGYTVGKNTIKTTSGVAGSWAGGIGGAKAGAALGSAIGTLICPGLGTAIGGVIGSIAGGVGGSIGGRALGERAAATFVG